MSESPSGAHLTRALHPRGQTRVRILAAIAAGHVTETDIAAHIGRAVTGIRVHLTKMVRAGLLVSAHARRTSVCVRNGRETQVWRWVTCYTIAPVPPPVSDIRRRVVSWLNENRRCYVRAHVVASGAGVSQIEAHDALQHLLAGGAVRCIRVGRSLQWRAVADVGMAAK